MLPGNLVGKAFCKVGLVLIYPSRHEYTQRAEGTLTSENKQSWNKYCMDGFLAILATEGRNQVHGYLFSILFTHQLSLCWLKIIKIDSPKTLKGFHKAIKFLLKFILKLLLTGWEMCTKSSFLWKSWISSDRKWMWPGGSAEFEFFMLSISGPNYVNIEWVEIQLADKMVNWLKATRGNGEHF